MKREYAADTLKWNLTDLLTKEKDRATLDFLCECVDFLLKQPKPDAETGLAPCGCGGKARIEESPFADDVDNIGLKIYTVGCTDCTIGFEGYFTSNEDAQEHWNRAMSGGMCNHEN